MNAYDHVWYWHPKPWRPIPRKGQRCRVLVRSRRMGSVLVEFADGFRVITSRHAVRRVFPWAPPSVYFPRP
jgi:hypothetical protein